MLDLRAIPAPTGWSEVVGTTTFHASLRRPRAAKWPTIWCSLNSPRVPVPNVACWTGSPGLHEGIAADAIACTSGSLAIEDRRVLLDAVAALKGGDVLLIAKRDRLGRKSLLWQ